MKAAVCNRRHGVTLVRELTTTPKRTRFRQHVAPEQSRRDFHAKLIEHCNN